MVVSVIVAAALLCVLPVELTQADFEKLHKTIMPSEDPWKSVQWNTSLVEAQNLAAAARKPLFIWAMDGHPLGCT